MLSSAMMSPASRHIRPETLRMPVGIIGAALLAVVAMVALTSSVIISMTVNNASQRIERAQLGLADLLALMIDVETGVRGFAVTGNELFLQPYNEALPRIAPTFDDLAKAAGTERAADLAKLRYWIGQNLEIRADVVNVLRRSGSEAARAVIAGGGGKRRMDALRGQVATLRHSLSADRTRAQKRVDGWNFGSALLAILATIGASLLLGLAGLARRRALTVALDESKTEHRRTQDLNPQVPWTASPDGLLTDVGRHWLEWTGMTREQSLGEGWRGALHPEDLSGMAAAYATAIGSGGLFDFEHRIRMADGSFRWMRSRAYPFHEHGHVQGWYGSTEDIDDRIAAQGRARDMQAELLHAARLSAVGEVAATLAHELAQPLSSIGNYVEAVQTLVHKRDAMSLERAEHGLDAALGETVRTAEIVRGLRRFLRGEDKEAPHSLLELTPLVRKAVQSGLAGVRQQGLVVTSDFAPGLQVRGNVIRLEQVIANLVRNAAEAMAASDNRVLTVTTKAGTRGAGEISDTVCEVLVADTGPGLPSSEGFDVFRPFSTTKPDGMGLGLPLARRIAEEHGGHLTAASHGGSGTVFCLCLPDAHALQGASDGRD